VVPKRGDTVAQLAAEEFWADRVKEARSRYRLAKSQLRQVIGGQEKWPLPQPQRSALVHAARLEELAARNKYVHALRIFSELLVHGEVPD